MAYFYRRRKRKERMYVFDQKQINQVLYNLPNLVSLVKEYVVLKKQKSIYVGRCPFCHPMTDNSKHFIVSEKGFKCFECGKGGTNAFGFFMIYFDKPFDDVLRWLNLNYTNPSINLNFSYSSSYKKKMDNEEDDYDLPF
jgi:DNA primase